MILAEAGIRPGMRVLDLGCGAGDVALLAADLGFKDQREVQEYIYWEISRH